MAERDRYRPHLPAPITSLFPCCQASPLPLLHLAPLHPNCLLAGLPPPSGPSIAARVSFPRWKSEWVTQLKILLTALGYPLGWSPTSPALQSPSSGPGAHSRFISQAVERIAFLPLFQADSCLFTFFGVVPSAWGPSSYPSSANSHSSFPGGSAGKKSACNVGDLSSIPGLGRSLGEGKGYPLQHSSLENSMDCIGLGVTKSRTQLNDFHFHFSFILQNPVWLSPARDTWGLARILRCHRNGFSLVHTNRGGVVPKGLMLSQGKRTLDMWGHCPSLCCPLWSPVWAWSSCGNAHQSWHWPHRILGGWILPCLPVPVSACWRPGLAQLGPLGWHTAAKCPAHSCPQMVDVAGVWGAVRNSETQWTERSGSCEGGLRPRQMDGKQAGKQSFLFRVFFLENRGDWWCILWASVWQCLGKLGRCSHSVQQVHPVDTTQMSVRPTEMLHEAPEQLHSQEPQTGTNPNVPLGEMDSLWTIHKMESSC